MVLLLAVEAVIVSLELLYCVVLGEPSPGGVFDQQFSSLLFELGLRASGQVHPGLELELLETLVIGHEQVVVRLELGRYLFLDNGLQNSCFLFHEVAPELGPCNISGAQSEEESMPLTVGHALSPHYQVRRAHHCEALFLLLFPV